MPSLASRIRQNTRCKRKKSKDTPFLQSNSPVRITRTKLDEVDFVAEVKQTLKHRSYLYGRALCASHASILLNQEKITDLDAAPSHPHHYSS